MNLDKAIEIKEQEQLFHPRVHDPDKFDANQLSLEALKYTLDCRLKGYHPVEHALPGETEADESP